MMLLGAGAIKVALLLVLAIAATWPLRRRSAASRHWVLAIGLACAAVAPALAPIVPSWSLGWPATATRSARSSPSSSVTTSIGNPQAGPGRTAEPAAATARAAALPATRILGVVWLGGTAIAGCVLLIGLLRLKRIAAAAEQLTDGPLIRVRDELSAAAGLRRPIVLLQSAQPTLLVTWGCRRPRVILPAAASGWTDERMRIVLGHELAHIRRGDWVAQLLGELLRAAYWFNPLVWIACRRLRRESEQACDDAVLRSGVDPTDYATHLVDLARLLNAGRRAHVPAPAMARRSSLEGRISAMLNVRLDRRPLPRSLQVGTAAAFFAATALIAGAAAQARYSTFSGTVVDQTNGFLPDTTLSLTNTASRARHEVKSDPAGRFEFVGLPAGEYTLQVTQRGFSTLSESIQISRDLQRTIELQVGSLQEMIRIVDGPGDAPADPSRTEKLLALRQKAQQRQQRATERCEGAAAGGIGGNILQPWKLVDVRPRYPSSGASGVVTMEAVIGTDGAVREVRVISSPHPDLERAALDAVRQWEFTPTILNCTPIEVRMQVTATFAAQP